MQDTVKAARGLRPAAMLSLNEAGLAAGACYFPSFAQYTEITPQNPAKSR